MTPIEIGAVSHDAQAAGVLRASGIDAPGPGDRMPGYGLDVRGWVLGGGRRVTAVELVQDGALLRRVPLDDPRPDVAAAHPGVEEAGSCGFFAPIGGLSLHREFDLLVRARLEDKSRVALARITGRRTVLRTSFEPHLQPLLVTTLGRTGSTAVVRLLGAHPQVVAYRPFEYEPRVATYWMGVLKGLSEPAAARRQITPQGPLEGPWWLGTDAPLPRRLKDPEIQDWVEGDTVGALAGFCQQRVEGLYQRVAALTGRTGATHFVEKFRPDGVPALIRELYPAAREVVLVRDFRDMAASMFAFNEKRGVQGFRRDRSASDADYVAERIGPSAAALARAWRERSSRAHLLRYEDLILEPQATVARLLGQLGLDAGPATIEEMLAGQSAADSDRHRTVQDPRESIGRWRRDFSPQLQAACEQALGPALQTFGYEPSEPVTTR